MVRIVAAPQAHDADSDSDDSDSDDNDSGDGARRRDGLETERAVPNGAGIAIDIGRRREIRKIISKIALVFAVIPL